MGEFQCYKFKSVDRALTADERQEVDALSSRGKVTNTSATFVYHYSDFRHSPEWVLRKYFDVMLYFANWGTRQLMFRLPLAMVDMAALRRYAYQTQWGESYLQIKEEDGYCLIDCRQYDEEGGDWMDEDDYDPGDLAVIRDNIIHGDYRALYLFWASLSLVSDEDEEYDEDEEDDDDDGAPALLPPPVPAGLQQQTGALDTFMEFLQISDDVLTTAQSVSPHLSEETFDYNALLAQLPPEECTQWLARLLNGELLLDVQLRKRLETFVTVPATAEGAPLTASELKSRISATEEAREIERAAEARAAYEKSMHELAGKEELLWKTVSLNLARQSAKSRELATQTLQELKALADFQGKQVAFREKMDALQKQYSRRGKLLDYWAKVGLIEVKS